MGSTLDRIAKWKEMTMSVTIEARPETEMLSDRMKIAQQAVSLPEIQEISKTLAKFNLGIFMPHMHDDETGQFIDLPDDMMSLESGLKTTFETEAEMRASGQQFVDVGWQWTGEGLDARMGCKSRCVMMGTMHTSGHDSTVAA
jgi:hypothetical protein